MKNEGPFAKLVDEFGGAAMSREAEAAAEEENAIEEPSQIESDKRDRLTKKLMGKAAGTGKLEVKSRFSKVRRI